MDDDNKKEVTADAGKASGFKKSSAYEAIMDKRGILVALVALIFVMSLLSERFFTTKNVLTILRSISINAMLCFGMTNVILTNGIDLSVGSVYSLGGTLCCVLITYKSWKILPAMLAGTGVGALCGLGNGLLVSTQNLAPFIVTLAMNYMARGISYIITAGMPVPVYMEEFFEIGNGQLRVGGLNIPYLIVYMLVVFAIMWVLLNKTRFGRRIYAVGGNETAANFSGISLVFIKTMVYVILGLLAGLCGIFTNARLYSGQPTIGEGAELDAIAAVILGGTSFSGGIGTLTGSLIGAGIIGILSNGLNLLGVNSFWQHVAKGIVILLAVYIDMLKNKFKLRSA